MGRLIRGGVTSGSGLGFLSVSSDTLRSSSGTLKIASDAQLQIQSDLRFADADSSNYVGIQSPTTLAANYQLTLPTAAAVSNGQALVSTTGGVLSWANAGGGTITTTSTPASFYPTFASATSGDFTTVNVNSNLQYNPSTDLLSVGSFTATGTATFNEITEGTTSVGTYGTSQSRPFTDGSIFILAGITGNYTFNWTGVPATTNRAYSLTHIIDQGATPRVCTTLQINSVGVTINYAGNVTPTGSANRRNIISFFITNTAGTFVCSAVLGSY